MGWFGLQVAARRLLRWRPGRLPKSKIKPHQDRYDGKDKELIHKLSSIEQNMAEAPFIKQPCIGKQVESKEAYKELQYRD